jgi:hypothetical protein
MFAHEECGFAESGSSKQEGSKLARILVGRKSCSQFSSERGDEIARLGRLAASQRLPPATGQHPGIAHVKRH